MWKICIWWVRSTSKQEGHCQGQIIQLVNSYYNSHYFNVLENVNNKNSPDAYLIVYLINCKIMGENKLMHCLFWQQPFFCKLLHWNYFGIVHSYVTEKPRQCKTLADELMCRWSSQMHNDSDHFSDSNVDELTVTNMFWEQLSKQMSTYMMFGVVSSRS